ncbi:substrate-binding domain-containing protein [Longispora sp. K20-0274]|uniref:substrate-binding domain-containing protein n=1 Tax=Longispora sp. K20-0274 TaxID=3088255 RepID=UPI00399ADA3F
MHAAQRQRAIVSALRRDGSVRTAELAAAFGVSPLTIRRDFLDLERHGDLSRVHGGAVLPALEATAPARHHPDGFAYRPSLGMVVPAASQYFREIVNGARQAAAAHDIELRLAVTDYDAHRDRDQVRRLLDAQVEGLLFTPSEAFSRMSDELDWITRLPVPVLFVERPHEPSAHIPPLEYVATDHQHGASQAVYHLAELGHRRIALLSSSSHTGLWLRAGYDAAIDALDLPRGAARITDQLFISDPEEFARAIGGRLDAILESGATAVLAHPDASAISLLHLLRARGLRAPGDLSIVAYDDDLAAFADIPLTAVAPQRDAVGRVAVELLLRRLADSNPHRALLHVHVLPRLVVRASTGPPPGVPTDERL